ncbi:carbamoyltransferase N-terminal domain-containing protein [Rhodococcus sp. BH5]|uniref:carbamoyltransferase N-terminal domain-containing protein n=1 Tax=Rhodococcus sp. BH5 TaxID=2871702 RepID=UPI0022CDB776|nr:carbamoyltransferase N-terminal domain-containing protein [Rhodococcus sp. BH5]MCZ9634913.1 nodulation protein NodU [Rhodococcus sp. BH5]
MLICGLKLTHDGGIALIEDGTLVASVEIEKLDNNMRFQPLDRLELVEEVIASEGFNLDSIDQFAIDGWFPGLNQDSRQPILSVVRQDTQVRLAVSPYCEQDSDPVLARRTYEGLPLGDRLRSYTSYHHSAQHLIGAYATSPFASKHKDSLVLVWDGGMTPTLYSVQSVPFTVTRLCELFPLYGSIFGDFCGALPVFKSIEKRSTIISHASPRNLDVAGKAMAYAALGEDHSDLDSTISNILSSRKLSYTMGDHLARTMRKSFPQLSDADLVSTFQGYLGRRLYSALEKKMRDGNLPPRICIAGGCALNIKWNSLIRSSELFEDMWVPPFPNDSGAALGAAALEWTHYSGRPFINWDVYSGPGIPADQKDPQGWISRLCDVAGLAEILHNEGKPIVVLTGRAELGPRSLGHRSIFAPATDPRMKDEINRIKGRENYRPVAPVCLEHRAPDLFSPGTPDPYMLFDHRTRADWIERVPAIVHLDETARLQTVNESQSLFVHQLLTSYEKLSGIPLLCNTSANYNGRGFFPDVESAASWNQTTSIWSNGRIYQKC